VSLTKRKKKSRQEVGLTEERKRARETNIYTILGIGEKEGLPGERQDVFKISQGRSHRAIWQKGIKTFRGVRDQGR